MTLRLGNEQGTALPNLKHDEFDLEAITDLQRDVLDHCRTHTGRMAILDVPRRQQAPVDAAGSADLDRMTALDPAAVIEQCNRLAGNMAEPINGALYYPWIETREGDWVPPCGHIAGIYARSDARTGVYKAPANEEIRGAVNLDYHADQPTQGQLNAQGINCLRAFPGRGIRVWGARTLSRDANWRYVNVRRLFLTLARWIEFNMGW